MPERLTAAFLLIMGALSLAGMAHAVSDVGSVIAVKNTAIIERENRQINAKIRDGILAIDTLTTLEASRAKMLFSNDSVVTLGERSRMIVEEYLHSEGKRGRSVFNLIDGKMRSVVGNTDFEIHTPSAVAAARGTVILTETWVKGGAQCKFKNDSGDTGNGSSGSDCKKCSTIVSVEGDVDVKNQDENVKGSVQLNTGWKTDVCEGEPPTQPEPASPELLSRLLGETDIGYFEITIPEPVEAGEGLVTALDSDTGGPGFTPPLDQQPLGATSSVNVNVIFP